MSRRRVAQLGWGVVQNPAGDVQNARTVTIKNPDGTAASVYTAATGSTPQATVTNSRGEIPGWIEEGPYLLDRGDGSSVDPVDAPSSGRIVTGTAEPVLASLNEGDTYYQVDGSGNVIAEWVKTSG